MKKKLFPTRSRLGALVLLIALLAGLLSACAQGGLNPTATVVPTTGVVASPNPSPAATSAPSGEVRTLKVMTHDSFAVSDSVVAEFEQKYNAKLQFIQAGDAGTALNKAILSKDNPIADVFYGVDNTFLSRALDEGIYEPYDSPVLAQIPDKFKLDPQNRALPVDFGDVCLNYDKAYFSDKGITPPQNLDDLLKPDYKSLLVVENPATSSPGLAFLLTTIADYGENGYLDYWKGLASNDVKVVNSWENAYYEEFTRAGGTRPIVVSYGSSPAYEVLDASQPQAEAPTAAVTADNSCFRQIEFVGILKGAQNRDLAEKWVDFMLSPTFQEDMPAKMFVFPVNPNAKLDEAFVKYMDIPESTAQVDPAKIAANREKWIQAWTETVLR